MKETISKGICSSSPTTRIPYLSIVLLRQTSDSINTRVLAETWTEIDCPETQLQGRRGPQIFHLKNRSPVRGGFSPDVV